MVASTGAAIDGDKLRPATPAILIFVSGEMPIAMTRAR
jgi:hypothetical protein